MNRLRFLRRELDRDPSIFDRYWARTEAYPLILVLSVLTDWYDDDPDGRKITPLALGDACRKRLFDSPNAYDHTRDDALEQVAADIECGRVNCAVRKRDSRPFGCVRHGTVERRKMPDIDIPPEVRAAAPEDYEAWMLARQAACDCTRLIVYDIARQRLGYPPMAVQVLPSEWRGYDWYLADDERYGGDRPKCWRRPEWIAAETATAEAAARLAAEKAEQAAHARRGATAAVALPQPIADESAALLASLEQASNEAVEAWGQASDTPDVPASRPRRPRPRKKGEKWP